MHGKALFGSALLGPQLFFGKLFLAPILYSVLASHRGGRDVQDVVAASMDVQSRGNGEKGITEGCITHVHKWTF